MSIEEELIPVSAPVAPEVDQQQPAQLTPQEAIAQLSTNMDDILLQQEDNRAALLNAASLLWRELRAEVLELAAEVGRPANAPFKREAILKLLPEVELRENNLFQLSNIQSSTQKKLSAIEKLISSSM